LPLPGDVISSRFRLERKLGTGSVGTVFLARDLSHGRDVAVKLLNPSASGLDVERFRREIRDAAQLSHPHILAVYDSGDHEGVPFVVMPWVDGETLLTRLERKGRLPVNEALRIARALAAALAHAHGRGMVHRDVKPGNVLLDSRGHVYLADFGIAWWMAGDGRLTQPGGLVGSPMYMSPEQIEGTRELDGRSDLFSLGCVMFEMITGSKPFEGVTVPAILASHLRDEASTLRAVLDHAPGPLEDVVARLLAKDRAARYSNAEQLDEELGTLERRLTSDPDGALAAIGDLLKSVFAGTGRRKAPTPRAAETARTPVRAPESSIAVLPFVDLSGKGENEYFSLGFTEDIISLLSRVRNLHVASRTSVSRYKRKDLSVRDLARELGVRSILEGSVRRDGDQVIVSTRLIDAELDAQLWAESYRRRVADVFALQTEVSSEIAKALEVKLAAKDRRRHTTSADAYDLYLRGRYLWARRTEESLRKAIGYLERARSIDPDLALAEAALADVYVTLGIYGMESPRQVMPNAAAAAKRALATDPDLAEAITSQAAVRSLYEWDWPAAERDYLRALDSHSQYPVAHHWLASNLLTPLRRFEEARQRLESARKLDPLSPSISTTEGVISLYEGDPQRAADELSRVIDIHDDFGMAYYFLGMALDQTGQIEESIDCLRKAAALNGRSSEVLAVLAYTLSRHERPDADDIIGELEIRAREHYVSPALFAQISIGRGDREQAMAYLGEAMEMRSVDLTWLTVRPTYNPLREDPRFQALARRVGLVGGG
jgi:serine/threonine protein kinase/Flp pilus assembly protein TadD